jgi:hypothetical protein
VRSRFLLGLVVLAVACKKPDDTVGPDDVAVKTKTPLPPKQLRIPAKHRDKHEACSKDDSAAVVPFERKWVPPGPACKTKADCTARPNGRCGHGHCTYDACYEDKDCKTGVCMCQEENSEGWRCKPGDCSVDADCGAQGFCSPTVDSSCGAFFGVVGFYCHRPDDECTDDADCNKEEKHGYCAYFADKKHWACGYGICKG